MTQLIGSLIPLALGVAASPIAIVAVLVILLTKRARPGSLIFVCSWIAGITVALLVSVGLADRIQPLPHGFDLPFEGALTALLGVGLVGTAVLFRKGRLRSEDPYAPPRWVAVVDDMSPLGGVIIALTNAITSPKNLALAVAAGLAITSVRTTAIERTAAEAIYVLIASLTVVVPVVVYFVGGRRSEDVLARWKTYITGHAAAAMEVTILIVGLVMAARGLSSFMAAAM